MNSFRVFSYLVFSALNNLKRQWKLHMVTLGSTATMFLVLGGGVLFFYNLKSVLQGWKSQAYLSVYFQSGKEKDAQEQIKKNFCSKPFVLNCKYRSAEKARTRFLRENQDLATAVKSLASNPFPASIEMKLDPGFRNTEKLKAFAKQLGKVPGVDLVDEGGAWLVRWIKFLNVVDWVMFLLGLALALATVFVVSNTLKLIVYAKKDEVEILNLVGASDNMIRIPFLLEGMALGFLGALLSLVILYLCFFFFQGHFFSQEADGIGNSLNFLPWSIQITALFLGAILGLLGGMSAVGKFLRS